MFDVVTANSRPTGETTIGLQEAADEVFRLLTGKTCEIKYMFLEYGIQGVVLAVCDPETEEIREVIRTGKNSGSLDEHLAVILATAKYPLDPRRGSSREHRLTESHRDASAAVRLNDGMVLGCRFMQEPNTAPPEGDLETAEFSDLCELFILVLARYIRACAGPTFFDAKCIPLIVPRYEMELVDHFARHI